MENNKQLEPSCINNNQILNSNNDVSHEIPKIQADISSLDSCSTSCDEKFQENETDIPFDYLSSFGGCSMGFPMNKKNDIESYSSYEIQKSASLFDFLSSIENCRFQRGKVNNKERMEILSQITVSAIRSIMRIGGTKEEIEIATKAIFESGRKSATRDYSMTETITNATTSILTSLIMEGCSNTFAVSVATSILMLEGFNENIKPPLLNDVQISRYKTLLSPQTPSTNHHFYEFKPDSDRYGINFLGDNYFGLASSSSSSTALMEPENDSNSQEVEACLGVKINDSEETLLLQNMNQNKRDVVKDSASFINVNEVMEELASYLINLGSQVKEVLNDSNVNVNHARQSLHALQVLSDSIHCDQTQIIKNSGKKRSAPKSIIIHKSTNAENNNCINFENNESINNETVGKEEKTSSMDNTSQSTKIEERSKQFKFLSKMFSRIKHLRKTNSLQNTPYEI